MPSLKEQLTQHLPDILPKSSEEAINGTELLEKVQPLLQGEYAESSIRQHFSVMSADPTSPIAKVDQGQGYYFRTARPQAPPEEKNAEQPSIPASDNVEAPVAGRGEQREEKFRSLFIRWAESNNQFPMFIEHTKGTRQAGGINKWKFPDVVLVKWEVGEITDRGFRLAKDLLEVKRSLGEQPFRLTSVELKVELTASTLREAFFQCVSNSKWAHSAQLTVACRLADEVVAEELRRLGASYDLSVVSFGLDTQILESLPPADQLLSMPQTEFEKHVSKISLTRISQGKDRENLDWEHIRDLKLQSSDISDLFTWVAYCLEKKSPYSVKDWRNIAQVEKTYA
jgi:hypothetical protein